MLSKQESELSSPKSKIPKNWKLPLILFLGTILLIVGIHYFEPASSGLEHTISVIENTYQQWFSKQDTTNPLILFLLAFFGGLLASVSPCILALLPINLSYIGTIEITSRKDAFIKAGLFVLGNITILTMFGLFSSFASFVIVDFRGHINIIIGAIILVMGLSFAGIFHLPLPQTQISLPINGSFGVGLTFALVSSPCASPVLFAVLAAAASTGSQVFSVLTMMFYALGYTCIIFLASLFTGLVKQRQLLLNKSDWVIRFGSAALMLAGGYYIVTGIRWFF